MPRARYRRRRSFVLPAAVAVILAFAALFGYLALGNEIRIPWTDPPLVLALGGPVQASEPADEPAEEDDDRIRVPVTARLVPAYSKLTRDDVWNPRTVAVATVPISQEHIDRDGILVDVRAIFGRVLRRDKPAGYVFTERDFLPEGTRPGIVGGIPPGKRALRVEIDRIEGLVGLRPGDRFDVLSAIPVDDVDLGTDELAGPYGAQIDIAAQMSNALKRATVDVLVQNGYVVSPVETRQIPVTVSTLTQGMVTRTKTVQEMWVAVEPDEVAVLMEALAIEDARVHCAPRSGHPDDPGPESSTPGLTDVGSPFGSDAFPWGGSSEGGLSVVETIDGDERKLVPVRRRD